MIPVEIRRNRTQNWQLEMRDAIRDPTELCKELKLSLDICQDSAAAADLFPVFVPRAFLRRIQPGNPKDPLLLQVLPRSEEAKTSDNWSMDPVGDMHAQIQPGMLQKYHGRVLFIVTGTCPVHCRYCFRRHFPYSDSIADAVRWERAVTKIKKDPSISEVILSGGDPLSLVDESLSKIVEMMNEIGHLKRLRIHTRFPVFIPSRITSSLLELITNKRFTPIVVVHVNHPAEIDSEVAGSIKLMNDHGVQVLNQSVLLKNVNDSKDVLIRLSEKLMEMGVIPYYLHQLDRVVGAHHFEVPEQWGLELIDHLRRELPGYLVPRYVREDPGNAFKTPLM